MGDLCDWSPVTKVLPESSHIKVIQSTSLLVKLVTCVGRAGICSFALKQFSNAITKLYLFSSASETYAEWAPEEVQRSRVWRSSNAGHLRSRMACAFRAHWTATPTRSRIGIAWRLSPGTSRRLSSTFKLAPLHRHLCTHSSPPMPIVVWLVSISFKYADFRFETSMRAGQLVLCDST